MDQLAMIDKFFALIFIVAGLGVNVYLMATIIYLPYERDVRTLFNCAIPRTYIAGFFALMLVPAYFFHVQSMPYSAGVILITAVVASIVFDRLRSRAKVILRSYRFI